MNNEEFGGRVLMSVAGLGLFAVLIIAVYGPTHGSPYDRCAPDEVWAWQMAYRADAENREWECVAISDLITEVGE